MAQEDCINLCLKTMNYDCQYKLQILHTPTYLTVPNINLIADFKDSSNIPGENVMKGQDCKLYMGFLLF